jgi:hypothetical protein
MKNYIYDDLVPQAGTVKERSTKTSSFRRELIFFGTIAFM